MESAYYQSKCWDVGAKPKTPTYVNVHDVHDSVSQNIPLSDLGLFWIKWGTINFV